LFRKPYGEASSQSKPPREDDACISEPILFEVAKSTTHKEYDSEEILHLDKDEQSSSPSNEFEPVPAGPE
jgi:hypothetical protein